MTINVSVHGQGFVLSRRLQLAAKFVAVTLVLVPFVVATPKDQTPAFAVLHNFTLGADGGSPGGGLVRDPAGNFYGTTFWGGASNYGTIFRVDRTGVETVLYSFTGGTDGGHPYAGLVRDAVGNLYGTAKIGGIYGFGTVFKLDTTATETVLYAFTGGTDGGTPGAGLIRDAEGNLYGTTIQGGDTSCHAIGGVTGCGTVFALDPTGKETVLYSFTGPPDGDYPANGYLARDIAGNLYGTTILGGDDRSCQNGCGTVFKVDGNGAETVLYRFTRGTGGYQPYWGLIQDSAGNLYGTTPYGGSPGSCYGNGCGVVFKVDATGNETVLYDFMGRMDGSYPTALVMDSAGNLYGTTSFGGSVADAGTVFKLDQSANETVLHSFRGWDGQSPETGVLLDPAGNLYGTTAGGGLYGDGVVFGLRP
jgi:uncharacterized repeat protein (TIGR03803 family)